MARDSLREQRRRAQRPRAEELPRIGRVSTIVSELQSLDSMYGAPLSYCNHVFQLSMFADRRGALLLLLLWPRLPASLVL